MARTASAVLEPPAATTSPLVTTKTTVETVETKPSPPAAESPKIKGNDIEGFVDTCEEPNNYTWYLYRLNAQSKENDLGEHLHRIDEADHEAALGEGFDGFVSWVKSRFGGGLYRLRINGRRKMIGSLNSITVCSGIFKVAGTPILQEKELLAGITAGGAKLDPAMTQLLDHVLRDKSVDPETAINKGLELAERMNTRFADALKSQIPPQATPEDRLASVIKTLTDLGLIGRKEESAARPERDPLVEKLLNATIDRMLAPPAPPATPVVQKGFWEQVMEHEEQIRKFFGGDSAGGGKGVRVDGLTALAQNLPAILKEVPPCLEAIGSVLPARPGSPAGRGGNQAVIQGVPGSAGFQPATAPGSGPSHAPGNPAPQPSPLDVIMGHMQQELAEQFLESTKPEDAAYTADWVRGSKIGRQWCGLLATQTVDQLHDLIRTKAPILKPIAEDPRLPAWLGSFLQELKSPGSVDRGDEESSE